MSTFIGLQDGERLIHIFQEHWTKTLHYVELYLMGLFGAGVVVWVGAGMVNTAPVAGWIVLLFGYFSVLVVHHWLFIYLISLQISGWALTTRRIIDFRFLPYLEHDMTYITISEIKEIEKHQRGLLHNLLHYGDVEVNLAAKPESIVFHYVPYPGKLVHLVGLIQKGELNS